MQHQYSTNSTFPYIQPRLHQYPNPASLSYTQTPALQIAPNERKTVLPPKNAKKPLSPQAEYFTKSIPERVLYLTNIPDSVLSFCSETKCCICVDGEKLSQTLYDMTFEQSKEEGGAIRDRSTCTDSPPRTRTRFLYESRRSLYKHMVDAMKHRYRSIEQCDIGRVQKVKPDRDVADKAFRLASYVFRMLEPLSEISLLNFLEARPIVTAQGPYLTAADAALKDMIEETTNEILYLPHSGIKVNGENWNNAKLVQLYCKLRYGLVLKYTAAITLQRNKKVERKKPFAEYYECAVYILTLKMEEACITAAAAAADAADDARLLNASDEAV